MIARILAILFFTGAGALWVFSPWLGCGASPADVCADRSVENFGTLLSLGTVIALVLVGLAVWPLKEDSHQPRE